MMTYQELNNDEDFQTLSFDEQLQVRQEYLTTYLPADDSFNALPGDQKQAVFNTLMYQAPATGGDPERAKEYNALYSAIMQQNPEAQEEGLKRLTRGAFRDQLSMLDGISKFAGWMDMLDNVQDLSPYLLGAPNDLRDKELDGLRYALSQDVQTATKAKNRNQLATIGGVLADTALWYGATQPLALGLKTATGFGKAVSLARKTMDPGIGRFLATKLAPELLDSTRGGIIEVWRQNILGNVEANIGENPTMWEKVAKNSAIFGEDFLAGMVMFTGLSLIGKGGKQLIGTGRQLGKLAEAKKGATILAGSDEHAQILYRMAAGELTEAEIKNLPEHLQEPAERGLRLWQLSENVENLKHDDPKFHELFFANGHQIRFEEVKPGVFAVDDLLDETSKVKKFKKDAAYKRVNTILESRYKVTQQDLVHSAVHGDNLKVHTTLHAAAKDIDVGGEALARMTSPIGGRLNRANAGYVARSLMKKAGLEDSVLDGVKLKSGGRTVALNDIVEFEVPKHIKTIAEEEEYLSTMLSGIERVIKDKGGDASVVEEFKNILKDDRLNGNMTPLWVKYQAGELGYELVEEAGGKVTLVTPQGEMSFSGVKSAGDWLYKQQVDTNPKAFKEQIFLNAEKKYGYKMTELDDGRISLGHRAVQKSTKRTEFESVDELLTAHPELTPKTPVALMPRWNITDNNLKSIDIEEGVVSGPYGAVRAFTDSFSDPKAVKDHKVLKTTDTTVLSYDTVQRKYVVQDSSINFTYKAKDAGELKEFMKKSWDDYEQLQYLGAIKGARVIPANGRYLVYQKGIENPMTPKNLDELKQGLKELPEPEYVGKDLLEQEAFSEMIHREIAHLDLDTAPIADYDEMTIRLLERGEALEGKLKGKKAQFNPLTSWASGKIAPPDLHFKRLARENNLPEYWDKLYNVRRAHEKSEGLFNRTMRDFDKSVAAGISKESNKRLNNVLAFRRPGQKLEDAYKEMFKTDIPAEDLLRLKRTEEIFGALKHSLGVDGWKFLDEYYPRIKEFLAKEKPGTIAGDAAKWLEGKFGHKIKEVEFFANNLRIGDMASGTYMENLTDVVKHYIHQGYRTKFLNGTIKETNDWLIENSAKLSDEAKGACGQYLERISGFFDDADISKFNTAMYEASKKFMSKLDENGVIKKQVLTDGDLQNMLGFLNSTTIAATMSYRMWPIIRNLFQPYNTLGLVVSQDVVQDAMKIAIRDADKVVARMKAKGIITERNAMMHYTNDSFYHKAVDKGLVGYQSADHFNRAVVDITADLLLQDSLKLYQKTGNMEKFLTQSKLSRISPQDRVHVLREIEAGNIEGAIDNYSEILNHRTQFPYKSWENPDAFHGVIGKLFGAYQHYPLYYTANLMEGMKHGTAAEIAGSALSTATVGALAYTTFNEFLGINAQDFLFYTPVSMTGGPLWSLANDALALKVGGGYESDVAWEKLKRNVPSLLVPGFGAISTTVEGIQALVEGDMRQAYIKALSAPVGGNF